MDKHVSDLLSAYLDHELTDAERLQVENHLRACHTCRTLLDELSLLTMTLSSVYQSAEVPDSIEQRVMLRIAQHDAAHPPITSDRTLLHRGGRETANSTMWWANIAFAVLLGTFGGIAVLFGSFGLGPILSGFKILTSLLHGIAIAAGSIPYLAIGLAGLSGMLLLLSLWSLRRLLLVKEIT